MVGDRPFRASFKTCAWAIGAFVVFQTAFLPGASAAECSAVWDGGAETNSWQDAANWSTETLPIEGDHVCIPDPDGTLTVIYSSESLTKIASLTSSAALQIDAGTFVTTDEAPSTVRDLVMRGGRIVTVQSNIGVAETFNWSRGEIEGAILLTSPTADIAVTGRGEKLLSGLITGPSSSTGHINAESILTLEESFLSGLNWTVAGALYGDKARLDGSFTFTPTASFSIYERAGLYGTFVNYGSAVFSGDEVEGYGNFINHGDVEWAGNGRIDYLHFKNEPTGTFRVFGEPIASSSRSNYFFGPFENDGLVVVLTGELRLTDPTGVGNPSGHFRVANKYGVIDFGWATFESGLRLSGPGKFYLVDNVDFNDASITIDAETTLELDTAEDSDGGDSNWFEGSGKIEGSGTFIWRHGYLGGPGTLEFGSDIRVKVPGDDYPPSREEDMLWLFDYRIVNRGTWILDRSETIPGVGSTFINKGTVIHDGNPREFTFGVSVRNQGTFDLRRGELKVGGFRNEGHLSLDKDSKLLSDSSFVQTSLGTITTLVDAVDGYSMNPRFGRVVASDLARIDGGLIVRKEDGHIEKARIVKGASRAGHFASLSQEDIGDGFSYSLTHESDWAGVRLKPTE